jgi:hypothetical protein
MEEIVAGLLSNYMLARKPNQVSQGNRNRRFKMLDASEEIVTTWLHNQGFLVWNDLKVGQNEIDILAINPVRMDRVHCEISVQVSPIGHVIAGSNEPLGKAERHSLEDRVEGFHQRKFIGNKGQVRKAAESLLGRGYRKLFVCGNLIRSEEEQKDQIIRELKNHGIEITFFSEILAELIPQIGKKAYRDNPSRYIQLMKYFSSELRL